MDDKSSDDIVPKIQKQKPLVVARCSSVGSLMGMEYDSEATDEYGSETQRQKQFIPESSNLSPWAGKPTSVSQGRRLFRTRSLKYELEKLIAREKYQPQSTSPKAPEEPLRSSFIKALKKALGEAFENPLNPLYSLQKKTQEFPPSSMETTSIPPKSESTKRHNQQTCSQMGYSQQGHLPDKMFDLVNQTLSRLCCGKYCLFNKIEWSTTISNSIICIFNNSNIHKNIWS